LWVLLFHGGIAAMLLLYLLFWLHLNLAQMLPLAAGLGIFTAATGYKALSALSARRLAEEKVAGAASKKAN
jgi:oligosaccharyltransferase complex subunit delta (ribophorin II)